MRDRFPSGDKVIYRNAVKRSSKTNEASKKVSMHNLFPSLTRDVKLIFVTISMMAMMDGFIYTVLQLYLKSIGYTGTNLGAFMLVLGIANSALLIPFGVISDRVDRRKIMAAGTTCVASAFTIVLMARDLPVMLLAAGLWGIGTAMYSPCVSSMLADRIRKEEMVTIYTFQAILQNLLFGVSALIGWIPELLVAWTGVGLSEAYRLSMVWLVPVGFGAMIPLTKVGKISPSIRAKRLVSLSKPVMKLTFTQTIIGFGAGLSIPMLAYYLSSKFLVESGPIGTLNAVVSFVALPFYFFVPVIANRMGTLKAIVLPQLASIPLMLLMTVSPSFLVASVFFTFRQILMNMSSPLITAFTMRISRANERGTVTALTSVAWRVPNSMAAQVGGYMFDVNLDSPLYGTSLIYIIYISIFYFLFRSIDKERKAG